MVDSFPAIQLIETFPRVPSHNVMFMLEAMTFKVKVKCLFNDLARVASPDTLSVQAWTNIYHTGNPEGEWHSVDLEFLEREERNTLLYGSSLILTSHGHYGFTFRTKIASGAAPDSDIEWLWAGEYGQDGIAEVRPPTKESWTHGPDVTHITGSVHLGNFIAAAKADDLGIDAVLNVADNLDLVPEQFSRSVLYKKIPMEDGAMNTIPSEKIAEAVTWLKLHDDGERRILVNCRAGIGRAGSTVVAYVFATRPKLTFDEAYHYVFKKHFVYPHKNLKDTVTKLFREY